MSTFGHIPPQISSMWSTSSKDPSSQMNGTAEPDSSSQPKTRDAYLGLPTPEPERSVQTTPKEELIAHADKNGWTPNSPLTKEQYVHQMYQEYIARNISYKGVELGPNQKDADTVNPETGTNSINDNDKKALQEAGYRTDNMRVINDAKSGAYAIIFEPIDPKTAKPLIAFRGTETSNTANGAGAKDLKTVIEGDSIGDGQYTAIQKEVNQAVDDLVGKYGSVACTGHSQGGNLCQLAAADPNNAGKFSAVSTHSAPGLAPDKIESFNKGVAETGKPVDVNHFYNTSDHIAYWPGNRINGTTHMVGSHNPLDRIPALTAHTTNLLKTGTTHESIHSSDPDFASKKEQNRQRVIGIDIGGMDDWLYSERSRSFSANAALVGNQVKDFYTTPKEYPPPNNLNPYQQQNQATSPWGALREGMSDPSGPSQAALPYPVIDQPMPAAQAQNTEPAATPAPVQAAEPAHVVSQAMGLDRRSESAEPPQAQAQHTEPAATPAPVQAAEPAHVVSQAMGLDRRSESAEPPQAQAQHTEPAATPAPVQAAEPAHVVSQAMGLDRRSESAEPPQAQAQHTEPAATPAPVQAAEPTPTAPVPAHEPTPTAPVQAAEPTPTPPVQAPEPTPTPPVQAAEPTPAPPVQAPEPTPTPPVQAAEPTPAPPVQAPEPTPTPPVQAPEPTPTPPVQAPEPTPTPPVQAPEPVVTVTQAAAHDRREEVPAPQPAERQRNDPDSRLE